MIKVKYIFIVQGILIEYDSSVENLVDIMEYHNSLKKFNKSYVTCEIGV